MKKYTRPTHPYTEEQQKKNYQTFRLLGDRPLSAKMLDQELNALGEFADELAKDISSINAKGIDGVDRPENKNKVLYSTGKSAAWSQVNEDLLADKGVVFGKLAPNSVDHAKIRAGVIHKNKIPTGAINAEGVDHIARDSIKDHHIFGNISGSKIKRGTITATQLDPNSITEMTVGIDTISDLHLKKNSVHRHHIKAGEVVAGKLGPEAVIHDNIKDGAVHGPKISSKAITEDHLHPSVLSKMSTIGVEPNSITADHIKEKFKVGEKLDDGQIFTRHLTEECVVRDAIDDGAVDESKLQGGKTIIDGVEYDIPGAVTESKIRDGAVIESKLAGKDKPDKKNPGKYIVIEEGAVAREKLKNNSVSMEKLVGKDKYYWSDEEKEYVLEVIEEGAVSREKIRNYAVTRDKLDPGAVGTLQLDARAVQEINMHPDAVVGSGAFVWDFDDNMHRREGNILKGSIGLEDFGVEVHGVIEAIVNKIKSGPPPFSIASEMLSGGKMIVDGEEVDTKPAVTGPKIGPAAVTGHHIEADTLMPRHLKQWSVTPTKVAPNAITRTKIQDKAVTSDKIDAWAVKYKHIHPGHIGTSHMDQGMREWMLSVDEAIKNIVKSNDYAMKHDPDGSWKELPWAAEQTEKGNYVPGPLTVGGPQMQPMSIDWQHICNQSIFSEALRAECLRTHHISGDAEAYFRRIAEEEARRVFQEETPLTGEDIAHDEIVTEHLEEDCVVTDKLCDGAVTEPKLSGGQMMIDGKTVDTLPAVTEHKIKNFSVTEHKVAGKAIKGGHIDTRQITDSHMAIGTLTWNAIMNGVIVESKLAGGVPVVINNILSTPPPAVTTAKIRDGNVTAEKLCQDHDKQAVTTTTIRNKAVTEAKLSDEVKEKLNKATDIATGIVKVDSFHKEFELPVTRLEKNKLDLSYFTESVRDWFKSPDERPVDADSINDEHLKDECVNEDKLCENAVHERHIKDREITGDKIKPESINHDHFAEEAYDQIYGQIDGHRIHANISGGAITDKSVPLDKLEQPFHDWKDEVNKAIEGCGIKEDTLTGGHLVQNTITERELFAEKPIIDTGHIKPGSITRDHLTKEAGKKIWQDNIEADAVIQEHIKDGSITKTKLGLGKDKGTGITSEEIELGSIDWQSYANDSIVRGKLSTFPDHRPVITDTIDDGAITKPKLHQEVIDFIEGKKDNITVEFDNLTSNAVTGIINAVRGTPILESQFPNRIITTNALDDLSINEAKLMPRSVNESKLQDGSVTESKLAGGPVEIDGNLVDLLPAVTTPKIRDGNVTLAKLEPDLQKWFGDDAPPANKDSVVTISIQDNAVTGAKISKIPGERISTENIEESFLRWWHVPEREIYAAHLRNEPGSRAVTTDVIEDGNVTFEKLAPNIRSILTAFETTMPMHSVTEGSFAGRVVDHNVVKQGGINNDCLGAFCIATNNIGEDQIRNFHIPKYDLSINRLNPLELVGFVPEFANVKWQIAQLDLINARETDFAPELFKPKTDSIHTDLIKNNAITMAKLHASVDRHMKKLRMDAARAASPIGMIICRASMTPPSKNWVICDGQWLNKDAYNDLWHTIGNAYGERGNEFAIPLLTGRVIMGMSYNGHVIFDDGRHKIQTYIGATHGAYTHTLEKNEMPAHGHFVWHDDAKADHRSAIGGRFTILQVGHQSRALSTLGFGAGGWAGEQQDPRLWAQNTGGSQAHTNIQPSIFMPYFIRIRHDSDDELDLM